MTLWQHFKTAWLYARTMPRYTEEADAEDFWSKLDREAYTKFMESPTGQKLRIRQRNLIFKSAVNATNASDDISHRNGFANGITATFSWLDGHLLSPSSAHDEPEQPAEGVADLLESFTP